MFTYPIVIYYIINSTIEIILYRINEQKLILFSQLLYISRPNRFLNIIQSIRIEFLTNTIGKYIFHNYTIGIYLMWSKKGYKHTVWLSNNMLITSIVLLSDCQFLKSLFLHWFIVLRYANAYLTNVSLSTNYVILSHKTGLSSRICISI